MAGVGDRAYRPDQPESFQMCAHNAFQTRLLSMIPPQEPSKPGDYPRRCLLMTTGRTPQVVTETFYVLATRSGAEHFVPTEIHLVTTEEGRRQAELDLLDSGAGQLSSLCAELGLAREQVRFGQDTIHVVRDARGVPLEDIRNVADNRAGADTIVSHLRRLTVDPTSAVHVSLAGGRKTMGFYLGYAMSLFGRPQDRLSHVLVDPCFESLPDFFFPTRQSRILRLRGGRGTVDAKDASIDVADIPVVSLRGLLGPDLLGDDHASYAEIVRRTRASFDVNPALQADLHELRFVAAGHAVKMGIAEAVWYAFFVCRAVAEEPGVAWRNTDSSGTVQALRQFVRGLDVLHRGVDDDVCEVWIDREGQLDVAAADRLRTRVNNQLMRALGPRPAAPYLIAREGTRGGSRYRILLAPSSIHLIQP